MTRTNQHSRRALACAFGLGLAAVVGVLLTAAPEARAATLYVDPQLAGDCVDYDVAARSCGGGSEAAYAVLDDGVSAAQPGDEVRLREGDYTDQLVVTVSGAPGAEIVIGAHAGEAVVFTADHSPATIILDQVSYLIIEGLTLQSVRWVEATFVHHVTLRDNEFLSTPSSGTTGNVRFISADHNRIERNVMDDGNDNLLLIDSDHNLVADNTITEGRHSVLSVRCSNYNVIRNNYMANSQQKIGEIYDCGADTSVVPHAFDATTRNLFEHNTFAEAVTYYSTSGGNGIQYAGQDGIIRRNVFYQTNVGLGMQVYDDEALYNHDNRVYHNVFYDNHCAGISVRGSGVANVFLNNVLAANRGVSGDCFGEGTAQLLYRNPLAEIYFEANDFWSGTAGDVVIQDEFDAGGSVADFEASHPALFVGNLNVGPAFVDAAGHDFMPQPTSPLVDAGAFLTRAVGGGSGTSLVVEDARFFFDGFSIEGEVGDLIGLEGQTDTATVTGVDLATNTLTLSVALTWTAGQGVTLAYFGDGPDIGAYELGVSECSDGLDNDLDGLTDFPEDPGCVDAADMDETDCGDGICEGGESCWTCEADCGGCTGCVDSDGDGYGAPGSEECTYPDRDCDDTEGNVHPGATEQCDDGVDNDCDGDTDGADADCSATDPGGDDGGCGCASGSPAPTTLLVLVLFVLLWMGMRHRRQM